MTSRPVLFLITGDPASGKSTLAEQSGALFGIPIITRDAIKESLFDSLGWSDRDWSRRVGSASYEILFQFVEAMLMAGASFIVDCHFSSPEARQRVASVVNGFPHRLVEVTCVAHPDELYRRFEARAQAGGRHPGHVDHENLGEFRSRLGSHPVIPLIASSEHLVIDTGVIAPGDALERINELITGA